MSMENEPTPESEPYSTIRTMLGSFIGKKIVDITQHDKQEFIDDPIDCYIMLMFEDGTFIKFISPAGRSFEYEDGVEEEDEDEDESEDGLDNSTS